MIVAFFALIRLHDAVAAVDARAIGACATQLLGRLAHAVATGGQGDEVFGSAESGEEFEHGARSLVTLSVVQRRLRESPPDVETLLSPRERPS